MSIEENKRLLQVQIEEFSDWLLREGRPLSKKQLHTQKYRRNQLLNGESRVDLTHKAKKLENYIDAFIKTHVNSYSPDDYFLDQLKNKANSINTKTQMALSNPVTCTKRSRNALNDLLEALDKVIHFDEKQASTSTEVIYSPEEKKNWDVRHQSRQPRHKEYVLNKLAPDRSRGGYH